MADAAFPLVFWLPDAFTPGKLIFAEPSNDTPPIVRAVCNFVADAAFSVLPSFVSCRTFACFAETGFAGSFVVKLSTISERLI